MLTHSIQRATEKPTVYKRLKKNPNPTDKRVSFINRHRIDDIPANAFSRPYSKWHLSKEDEKLIDILEKKNNNQ